MAWMRSHKKGSGGGDTEPKIVYATSASRQGSIRSVSYTFTEAGTFQYYIFVNSRVTVTSSEVAITLNSTTLTPTTSLYTDYGFFYGEINVSPGDVLTATPNSIQSDKGIQLFVMKNCDVSAFSLVGTGSNNTNTFNISLGGNPYLQAFQCTFYGNTNIFKYGIMNYEGPSVSIPNISTYYYGFTYVITLVASNSRSMAKSVEEQEEKESEGKEMEEKKIEEPDEKVEEVKEEEVKEEER